MAIKPIETIYNGYRFRSRLEARWAVFFDALGIWYEYESQGFDLGKAGWYLPDFLLVKEQTFVEIKPSGRWFFLRHLEALAEESGEPVLQVVGNPWPGEYGICVYDGRDGMLSGSDPARFALDRRDGHTLWVCNEWFAAALSMPDEDHDRLPLIDHGRLTDAYSAARQARFEYGASG